VWRDDETLVVAGTADAEQIERDLRAIASAEMRVVTAEHSHRALEELADAVLEEADRLGADWASIGVDDVGNRVEAMLEDHDAPASRALQRRFADSPIHWGEDKIFAAGPRTPRAA
jgi:hypothetical protein